MTTADESTDRTDDASRPGAPGFIPADVVREQFSRLRAELTEARREGDKWRVIAEERERALERADVTIQAFATALNAGRPIEIGGVSYETAALSRDVTAASRELAAASRDLAEVSRSTPPGDVGPPPGPDLPAPDRPAPVFDLDPVEGPAPTVAVGDPRTRPGTREDDDVVEIPRHIREEAERYAQTLQAISEFKVDLARPHRWWQFWR
ncbi:MAG: hypothetical protein ACKOBG_00605 [Actinomycetota bacterium]